MYEYVLVIPYWKKEQYWGVNRWKCVFRSAIRAGQTSRIRPRRDCHPYRWSRF